MTIITRIAAAVGVAAALLCAAPADAAVESRTRVAGTNRYATAVEISQVLYERPPADAVVIATGENFPDALAAGTIAGSGSGMPVLLVQRDAIPEVTSDELTRLGPTSIYVLGGSAAVSDAVFEQLRSYAPNIERRAGADRYATAVAVGRDISPGVPVAFVASGATFADALLASSIAGRAGGPVLLTSPGGLPDVTRAELDRLDPDRIVVIGSTASVPSSQLDTLRTLTPTGDVVRLAGDDQFATSVAVSSFAYGPPTELALLATGRAYPDALAAGALASVVGAPLLFADTECVPSEVDAEITSLDVRRLVLFGGTAALSTEVEAGTVCGSGGSSATPPEPGIEGFVAYDGADITGQANSSGETNTISEPSPGEYLVRFRGMATDSGVVHVMPGLRPGNATACNPISWAPDGDDLLADIRCTNTDGTPASHYFNAVFTQWHGTSARGYAYVRSDPTVDGAYAYNGGGGAITASAAGAGTTRVRFADVAPAGTGGGTAIASAYGHLTAMCVPSEWAVEGNDVSVEVYCFDDAGPVTTDFTVTWVDGTTIVGPTRQGAYALSGAIPSSATWAAAPEWSWSGADGDISFEREDVGFFRVRFPGLGSDGAAVFAQAADAVSARCLAGGAPDGTTLVVTVYCSDPSISRVDTPFVVQVIL